MPSCYTSKITKEYLLSLLGEQTHSSFRVHPDEDEGKFRRKTNRGHSTATRGHRRQEEHRTNHRLHRLCLNRRDNRHHHPISHSHSTESPVILYHSSHSFNSSSRLLHRLWIHNSNSQSAIRIYSSTNNSSSSNSSHHPHRCSSSNNNNRLICLHNIHSRNDDTW